MNLRILFNILLLLTLNLLIKPFWSLGIDLQVQNKVGASVYGTYQALLSLSLIFSIALDLGIQTYNSTQVANAPNVFQNLFPNMIVAKLLLALIYGILLMLLGYWLSYRGMELFLLFLLGIMQVAVSMLLFVRSNIAALQKFNFDSVLSVFDKLVAISLCGYFIYIQPDALELNIYHFALFQVIGYVVTLILGLIMTARFFSFTWTGFNIKRVNIVIKKGVPYAILVFFMSIYTRSDMVLLDVLSSKTNIESGIYAASYRLLDLSNNMLGVLIAGLLMPLFVKMIRNKENLIPVLNSVSLLLACSSLWISLWINFYGEEIIGFLYDDHHQAILQVLVFLFWVLPFSSMSYIYSTLLTAGGYLKYLIKIAILVGVGSLLLNMLLIPKFGAMGAAVVSILAHSLYVISVMLKVKKIYSFQWPWKSFIRLSLWLILTVFLFLTIRNIGSEFWLFNSLIIGGCSLVFMFFILGVHPQMIRNIISKAK